MPNYRRSHEGQVYFFTLVTHRRRKILTTDLGRHCLRTAIQETQRTAAFRIVAIVLLPDHLHAVWELPRGDLDYSIRWRKIKSLFTRDWLAGGGSNIAVSASRRTRGEQGVWQRRFFEHTVRDDDDLKRCVDYVHFNPVKHGYVERVWDWHWSTFHRFVAMGEYPIDWGGTSEFYGDEFLHAE